MNCDSKSKTDTIPSFARRQFDAFSIMRHRRCSSFVHGEKTVLAMSWRSEGSGAIAGINIRETKDYAAWFAALRDDQVRGRILARIRRAALGNFGDSEPVGGGISEMRIDYGLGYRIYLCSVVLP